MVERAVTRRLSVNRDPLAASHVTAVEPVHVNMDSSAPQALHHAAHTRTKTEIVVPDVPASGGGSSGSGSGGGSGGTGDSGGVNSGRGYVISDGTPIPSWDMDGAGNVILPEPVVRSCSSRNQCRKSPPIYNSILLCFFHCL